MAITVPNAAAVKPLNGARVRRRTAGAALTPGLAGYIAESDGRLGVADKDALETSRARGVVLASNGMTSYVGGDPIDLCVSGPVAGFSGMTPGKVVYVGDDGGLTHTPSVTAGDYNAAIGYAESDSILYVQPQVNEATVVA